jgi:hypothetical protein
LNVTVHEKAFVIETLENCEHLTYIQKNSFLQKSNKKLMLDRIELIQTPIERTMSGLFKERINKKSIFFKFSDRKDS